MKNIDSLRKLIFLTCGVCLIACCVFLSVWFVSGQSVKERNLELAEEFHSAEQTGSASAQNAGLSRYEESRQERSHKMDALRQQNDDLAGWLLIEGTEIDYPVVRHTDNEYYLTRNFWREDDKYGAIFMDCANTSGFDSAHTIVYGHNMKDGAMFGALLRYLDPDYLSENPFLTVIRPDGNLLDYRVFAAKKAYTDDPAYRLRFTGDADFAGFAESLGVVGAPPRILTLSTCSGGSDRSERMLIHAALVK